MIEELGIYLIRIEHHIYLKSKLLRCYSVLNLINKFDVFKIIRKII